MNGCGGGGQSALGGPIWERDKSCGPRKYWVSGLPAELFTLVGVFFLAGCAGQPAADPEPRIVRVEVPVQMPCRTDPVPRPAFAVDSLRIGASIDEQMRALRAERRQRQGYEERLVAAVEACRYPPQNPTATH